MAKIGMILIFLAFVTFSCNCSDDENEKEFSFVRDYILAHKSGLNAQIYQLTRILVQVARINKIKEKLRQMGKIQDKKKVELTNFFRF